MRRFLIVIVLLALGAGAWLGWRQYSYVAQPFKGFAGTGQFVEIPPKSGPAAIGRLLIEAGVVHDSWTWRIGLWQTGSAGKLKAGEYRFDRELTVGDVIRKVARGEVYLRPITFPEGLSIRQMAHVFEDKGFGPAASFVEAARDVSLVAAIDPAAHDLEGYLFPDTYPLPRKATARDLVRKMVARFDAVFTPSMRDAATAAGMSTREAVTLASLVEKETARADERSRVAAVYLNRLEIRMALQCDPTVIFALDRVNRYHGNLTHADLSFDSPYNTYRYPGLPPGPIASPGRASLDAVLRPMPVRDLYFVSRNDGSHAFAETLDEHNRNVKKYQVDYFKAQRAQDPAVHAAATAPRKPAKRH